MPRSRLSGLMTAARIGWWFGFGYFVTGLWWLGAAFLVEADKFAWALPLGVVGLPAVLAIFTAAGFLVARSFWSGGAARLFALAAGLGLSEWLRGILFTGFPWNDMGMVLGGNLVLGQFASIAGLHGLTFLTVAIAAAPATLADGVDGLHARG
ncbi:MAG: apolipoprotein N-acyltransferase, partial [Hyphomicrobiales bacterium]|nr:apolipoprotein N-acyltransferase [Hyphomicrobiales bacterium]